MGERIYGLIGRKLGHSYSVAIHNLLGNPAYRLYELEPEALGGFLADPRLGGLNVTIPYKRAVLPYCDWLSPEAAAIGSVNTLVRRDGLLRGYNTDAAGFAHMADQAGIDFAGRKVLVFGSGGASLTVQNVAKRRGAAQVTVISRSGADNYDNLDRHRDAQLLVNATPLGMYPSPGEMPADPGAFPHCQGVLDLCCNPRRSAFLLRAEALGLRRSGGLPMLVTQAKEAAALFFDQPIDDSETSRIIEKIRQDTGNIVLIGMPGSGKTVIGQALAAQTGRRAVDIDQEIARDQGRTIASIFAQEGEAAFRALERTYTARFGMESGIILMTGGGVVLDAGNYPSLHQNGRIYHIQRDPSLLAREGRPLSQSADLTAMQRQREPLYRAFRDAAIDNNGDLETAADAIWRDFCANSGD